MKIKAIILFIIIFVAVFGAPTTAFAYSGVQGDLVDQVTGHPWSNGGYIYIWNITAGVMAGQGAFTGGSYSIPYTNQPNPGPPSADQLVIYILPAVGSAGPSPTVISPSFIESGISSPYQVGTLTVQAGPNSVELVDFSVTSESRGNSWLPFILLIGSVVLVTGAVFVIRKYQP